MNDLDDIVMDEEIDLDKFVVDDVADPETLVEPVEEIIDEPEYGSEESEDIPEIINGIWRIDKELGSGSFGVVYMGTDIHTGEEVAIKMEPREEKHRLKKERKIYKTLEGGEGVPNVRWYGKIFGFNILVIDLLGPSLEDAFDGADRLLSLKTVLLLADQLLHRIEQLHNIGFVHRDVKAGLFSHSNHRKLPFRTWI